MAAATIAWYPVHRQIPSERFPYFRFVCVRMLEQQRVERHQNPRRAEATLQSVQFLKRLLQRMQRRYRGKPFDRADILTVGLDGEHKTRPHGPAVQLNRTRPAGAVLATHVRTTIAQLVPQDVREQRAWFDLEFVSDTVDGHMHGDAHAAGKPAAA